MNYDLTLRNLRSVPLQSSTLLKLRMPTVLFGNLMKPMTSRKAKALEESSLMKNLSLRLFD